MANEISAPFDASDLEALNERLKELDEADKLIAKAKQAGMDIGDQEKESRELRQRLMRIKQTFFPGK